MELVDLERLARCTACERLAQHGCVMGRKHPGYFAKPVPANGPRRSQILVVGLAPGLHGAFRTGKPFVGDASGDLLYSTLYDLGLASCAEPTKARLRNVRITNAVKCLPPGNAPAANEVNRCRSYLKAELNTHAPVSGRKPRVVVSLGGTAYRSVARCWAKSALERPPQFAHGARHVVRPMVLHLASFHPSRLNINTGRIDAARLRDVFQQALIFLAQTR